MTDTSFEITEDVYFRVWTLAAFKGKMAYIGQKEFSGEYQNRRVVPLDALSDEVKSILGVDDVFGIACWGDSLTYSHNTTIENDPYLGGVTYPSKLSELTGQTVYNLGMPGANAMDISGLQGGMPIYVDPFVLPADASKETEVILRDANGDSSYIGLLHWAPRFGWINPVTNMHLTWIIDNIPVNLSYNAGKMVVRRISSSDAAISFTRPVRIMPIHEYAKGKIMIFWVGTNDSPTTHELAERTVRIVKNMVDFYGGEKYLVIGMTVDKYAVYTNPILAQTFGNRYVNMKDYLVRYGLADNNLSPTPQDTTDIGNGVIPSSLRSDAVHFNDYGYTAIANCVYEHGKDLKYWPKRAQRYGILWDKTNAVCTRLYDAVGMTANAYKGSYNAGLVNDFDGRYPWSGRRVVNVDLDEYRRIKAAGGDIFGSIVAWDGDADFALDGSNGFVGVYTPEFWVCQEETSEGVEIVVADRELPGYIHFPATIGGRYFASSDGNGGITSKAGAVPLSSNMEGVNYTFGKLHELATAGSMTLDDVYTWVADTILLCVEFATMNTQSAVGNGVSYLYRENAADLPLEAGTGNSVIVPSACANAAIPGAIIDFGTSLGSAQTARRAVTAVNAYAANADYKEIVFDGAPVTYTTATIVQIHGLTNTEDAQIGSKSGYIGINSKSHAYYRGRIAHANMFRYVLGVYRQKGTGHIWYAKDREQAAVCDALDVDVHLDSGFALPHKADGTSKAEGFIKAIGFTKKLPLWSLCTAVGGNTRNPIGDYCWHPGKTADNTVAIAGGNSTNDAGCGRFSVLWGNGSGTSHWSCAALPFLI